MKTRNIAPALALASLLALTAGCASTRPSPRAAATDAAKPAEEAKPVPASPEDAARTVDAEPDARDLVTREVAELKTVHFAYDSDRLDDAARATLRANADYLKAHPELKVQVAGNCDQRGTVAYNLALGQRRAASVRSYYKTLGVEGARVATISFGQERPVCADESEDCWARNRRAATLELLSPRVAASPSAPRSL
jgi:peptidoglycan-associated lipoprotein